MLEMKNALDGIINRLHTAEGKKKRTGELGDSDKHYPNGNTAIKKNLKI